MHILTISEKEDINLKESGELYMGGFGKRKDKGEMSLFYNYFCFLLFLETGFLIVSLFWDLLCRSDWPQIHKYVPASASMTSGSKGMCHLCLAILLSQKIKI